jgi:DNA-binding CsgD family transcriptional regulator
MSDWISVVEAAYDLSQERVGWLEHLLDQAAPLLDRGVGVNAQVFHVSPTRFRVEDVAVRGLGTREELRAFLEHAPPQAIDAIYRQGAPVGSLSEFLFPRERGPRRRGVDVTRDYFVENTPAGFQDAMGVVAHTGTGSGVVLNAPLPASARMSLPERRHWSRIVAHLAAGLRLRQRMATVLVETDHVEAIMDPDGRMHHARAPATPAGMRDRLRAAVRKIDRARCRATRNDPDKALDLWEGLVHGRWSLLDRFDSDQRRFVVAVKNDPTVLDLRGLTQRERQIAEFCGLNRGAKEIAYILGLSSSLVGNTMVGIQRKLGVRSRTELAALFSPLGARARMTEFELGGESLAVGSYPLADEERFAELTESERDVAIHLMMGATYREIGRRRSTSERTIANQTQSLYRKMRVTSRVELAAILGAPRTSGNGAP